MGLVLFGPFKRSIARQTATRERRVVPLRYQAQVSCNVHCLETTILGRVREVHIHASAMLLGTPNLSALLSCTELLT